MLKTLLEKIKRFRPAPMTISLSVLKQIRETVGNLPSEHGGVLGGDPESGVVTEFYFDRSARCSAITYTPDDQLLNRLFSEEWNPKGIRVMGIVHSHPGLRQPSSDDLSYSGEILKRISDLDRLLMPIVISAADSDRFEIHPFAVVRNGERFSTASLAMTVFDENGRRVTDWEYELDRTTVASAETDPGASDIATVVTDVADRAAQVAIKTNQIDRPVLEAGEPVPESFRRVVGAYDLGLMKESRASATAQYSDRLAEPGAGALAN